ncbi:MAG: prephenate dehydrogenase, partial [Longimicrobiales bacterium]
MTAIRSVGIIGLGVIGGSLARDLAARGIRVLAYDLDPAALRAARDARVVSAPLDPVFANAGDVDAVVIALPLGAALAVLDGAGDRLARVPLVTDVCSTKRTMAAAAHRLGLTARFVGSHPLAGDHRSGWEAARADLFRGATVYLCPAAETPAEPVAMLHALWELAGAVPETIDAAEHDRLLAWTSHLPQAASTALGRALARAGVQLDRLGPGGRDMTRLAHSSA